MMLTNNLPLLNQTPFGILGDYEPNLLMTKIHMKYDLKEIDKNSNTYLFESFKYSATNIHEKMHWHQFAGTTWGNWCMFIYNSRFNLFYNYGNNKLINKVIHNIDNFALNSYYHLDKNLLHGFSDDVILFYEDWIAHSLTYNLFINGGYNFEGLKRIDYDIATSLSFAYFNINNYLGLGEKGTIKEYEEALLFKKIALVKHRDIPLTVKTLLEGQARASELLYYRTLPFLTGDKNKYVEYITPILNYSDTYWSAFNIYLEVHNLRLENLSLTALEKELVKFCTLVDISLNPPIVPFYPKEYLKDLNWEELFPPIRFFRACILSSKSKTKINIDDDNSILMYCKEICDGLGQLTPTELAKYFLITNQQRLEEISRKWESPDIDLDELSFFDYLFKVIEQFSEIKVKYPLYTSNLGLSSTGTIGRKYAKIISDIDHEYKFAKSSPLVLDTNLSKINLHTPLHEEGGNQIFNWLSTYLIYNYLLSNKLLLNKSIYDNVFPFNIPDYVKENIINQIKDDFNVEVNWK